MIRNGIGTDLNRSCRAGEIVFFPSHRVPLSPFLSLTRARALTHSLSHTLGGHRAHSRAHSHTHWQSLSAALCSFSGNEWGATQGTVVLANDLPGSHDALNVGWAGGWRQRSREPGSSVGSLARPASNYPGALPRGLQDAVLLPCSPQLRKPERCWGGGGAGRGGVRLGGENTKPPNKRALGPPPPETKPRRCGRALGWGRGRGRRRGGARSAGAKSLYCHKMGPPSRSARGLGGGL